MSLSTSPKLIKGGLIVLDAATGSLTRTITLQYNLDTLIRSYQLQGAGGDGGAERAQPFRLKDPAIESIKLDAEIDATDSLEHPNHNANAVAFGIAPQLPALESLVNPSSAELLMLNTASQSGTLESPSKWGQTRLIRFGINTRDECVFKNSARSMRNACKGMNR